MLKRRLFITRTLTSIAGASWVMSSMGISAPALFLSAQSSYAESGGNGGGNGGDSGGGNGGSNGGDNGPSGENGGGKGNGGGNGNAGSNSSADYGSSPDKTSGTGSANRSQTDRRPQSVDSNTSFELKHSNGIREQLIGGRYVMRDRNGRTIINRPAAARDVYRFQHLDR